MAAAGLQNAVRISKSGRRRAGEHPLLPLMLRAWLKQ